MNEPANKQASKQTKQTNKTKQNKPNKQTNKQTNNKQTNKQASKRTNKQANERTNERTINQSINQSIHPSINQSPTHSLTHSLNQPTNQPINQSINQSINQHTYILTYLHTYILTYLHTYILTYLHTYILTYLHTYIHTYIHTNKQSVQQTAAKKWTSVGWRQTWWHLVWEHTETCFSVVCIISTGRSRANLPWHDFCPSSEKPQRQLWESNWVGKDMVTWVQPEHCNKKQRTKNSDPVAALQEQLWAIRPKRRSPRRPGWNRRAAAQRTSSATSEVPCTSFTVLPVIPETCSLKDLLLFSYKKKASIFRLPCSSIS